MDVLTAAAPQLNPMDCFTMFSSFRRLPAHTSVTGNSRARNRRMSFIVNDMGRFTNPETSTFQSSHDARGTAPWFRT